MKIVPPFREPAGQVFASLLVRLEFGKDQAVGVGCL